MRSGGSVVLSQAWKKLTWQSRQRHAAPSLVAEREELGPREESQISSKARQTD